MTAYALPAVPLHFLPGDHAHAVELSSDTTSEQCDCCQLVWNVADIVGFLPTKHNLCPLCVIKVLERMAESAHAW